MSYFDQIYLGNALKEWIIAAAVAVVVYIILKVAQKIILRRVVAFSGRTDNKFDDAFAELLKQTRFFFLALISVYAASHVITLPAVVIPVWNKIIAISILLQMALWSNGLLTFVLSQSVKNRIDSDAAGATTMSAMKFVGKIVIWSVVLLLVLDNLGVNITALVAGLGIGGIAAALALQNILSDLFASISIILDKPFVYGDFIIVDDLMGTIEHIGLKTTRVKSLSGEQIVFSNNDLLNSRVRNYKRMSERRILFTVGVIYQTPLEKLKQIPDMIKEIINRQEKVRFDRAHFKQYADSSLVYEIVYYVLDPNYNLYMDIQHAINLEIYRRFSEEKIEFAYPTTTVYLQK